MNLKCLVCKTDLERTIHAGGLIDGRVVEKLHHELIKTLIGPYRYAKINCLLIVNIVYVIDFIKLYTKPRGFNAPSLVRPVDCGSI